MTNEQRIKSMTAAELADFLRLLTDCVRCPAWIKSSKWEEWSMRPCYTGEKLCEHVWLDWLKEDDE